MNSLHLPVCSLRGWDVTELERSYSGPDGAVAKSLVNGLAGTGFASWYQLIHRAGFEREREMFYLTTHSTHFIYGYMASDHMVKDHSDSEKGNPLPPPRLLLSINSKGSFICTIPQTG